MNIYILRHGEAGRRLSVPSKDFERPLTLAGRKEIEDVAQGIQEIKLKFDKIISSPLKRCHDTAQIVAKEQGSKVEDWDELKPEGSRTELLSKLSKLKQDSDILLCGHDPYLSILTSELISGTPGVHVVLKKGGLVRIRITTFSPKPSGELRWLISPKLLKKLK